MYPDQTDVLSDMIWFQTVCKLNQQTTVGDKELKTNDHGDGHLESIESMKWSLYPFYFSFKTQSHSNQHALDNPRTINTHTNLHILTRPWLPEFCMKYKSLRTNQGYFMWSRYFTQRFRTYFTNERSIRTSFFVTNVFH